MNIQLDAKKEKTASASPRINVRLSLRHFHFMFLGIRVGIRDILWTIILRDGVKSERKETDNFHFSVTNQSIDQ